MEEGQDARNRIFPEVEVPAFTLAKVGSPGAIIDLKRSSSCLE